MKNLLLIAVLFSTNTFAIEKCELPLLYLDEATNHLIKNDDESAKRSFTIGFALHQTIESECNSNRYMDAVTYYIEQYANHVRT